MATAGPGGINDLKMGNNNTVRDINMTHQTEYVEHKTVNMPAEPPKDGDEVIEDAFSPIVEEGHVKLDDIGLCNEECDGVPPVGGGGKRIQKVFNPEVTRGSAKISNIDMANTTVYTGDTDYSTNYPKSSGLHIKDAFNPKVKSGDVTISGVNLGNRRIVHRPNRGKTDDDNQSTRRQRW